MTFFGFQFVNQESLVTALSDLYPSIFRTGVRRKLLLLALCVGSFLIGLLMVTDVRDIFFKYIFFLGR